MVSCKGQRSQKNNNEKSMTDTFINYFIKDETKNKSEHAATLSGLTIIASILGPNVASSSSASMSNYVSRNEYC